MLTIKLLYSRCLCFELYSKRVVPPRATGVGGGNFKVFMLLTMLFEGGENTGHHTLFFYAYGKLRRLHQHHQQGIQGTGRESHEDVLRHFRGNRNREGIPTAPVCKETA